MTTLVALASKDALVMGTDSLGTVTRRLVDPFDLLECFDPKDDFKLKLDDHGNPLLDSFSILMEQAQAVPYNQPASCITSRRNLHTPCIPRHRPVLRIQSPSRCAQRRERRPCGVWVIVTRSEEDAHLPIGPESPVFMGWASPFARDLCNIRVN